LPSPVFKHELRQSLRCPRLRNFKLAHYPLRRRGRTGDSVARARGRSSEAEHELPKLGTRVRFPSPALRRFPGQDALAGGVAARTAPIGQLRVKVVDATTSDCRPAASMVWGPEAPAIRAAGTAPSQVKVPVSEAVAEHTLVLCFPEAEPV
jgi:hypothetical protein